ncbi:hypothetical protein F5Y18DRAFT_443492 [Xylariaceae sp. FL1019]|nr:hypothetical protein F5Y18DRAFT_443492 [Xylariaceae sp. FL1019]
MQFTASLALLNALLAAAIVQAGPFTMRFHTSRTCNSRSLGCNRYDPYQCCDEPPFPSAFPAVRATSSGPFGIVVYTEVTSGGGCGLCETAGSLNTCHLNAPFHTLYVATFSQCQTYAALSNVSSAERIPVSERHAECNGTVPLNSATVNGHEYDLTGPDRLEVMEDLLKLGDYEFHVKYAHLYRGLATDGSPTTLATSTLSPTGTAGVP